MLPRQQAKMVRILAAMEEELQSQRPLVVGPWIGEVGYETLYWIPFVRWALDRFGVSSDRVIIVSRGGTASWYAGIGRSRYLDAFDLMSPAELTALAQGHKPKQDAFDDAGGDELLRRVKALCGLGDVARLLPHWMYRLFSPYWKGDARLDLVADHATWARVSPPEPAALNLPLPPRFVAARFYFSQSWPDNEGNRRFAQDLIDRLAVSVPVVMLNHPFNVDDHRDYQPASPAVMSVAGLMSPPTNLEVQTAVIGRAAAFVGTYGGLSLVPPICCVPSFAFFSVQFTKPEHEAAMARMIETTGGAPLRTAGAQQGVAQAEAVLAHLGGLS